ncbi:MAG: biotin/lipoyl-containing protein, partial [Planctomycetaceae bacterium]
MAAEVVIPRLGWSMEEGTFGEWLKPDGAVVKVGDPLFVLEGEKSAQDIEAVDAGVLRIPTGAPRAGDTVL